MKAKLYALLLALVCTSTFSVHAIFGPATSTTKYAYTDTFEPKAFESIKYLYEAQHNAAKYQSQADTYVKNLGNNSLASVFERVTARKPINNVELYLFGQEYDRIPADQREHTVAIQEVPATQENKATAYFRVHLDEYGALRDAFKKKYNRDAQTTAEIFEFKQANPQVTTQKAPFAPEDYVYARFYRKDLADQAYKFVSSSPSVKTDDGSAYRRLTARDGSNEELLVFSEDYRNIPAGDRSRLIDRYAIPNNEENVATAFYYVYPELYGRVRKAYKQEYGRYPSSSAELKRFHDEFIAKGISF